MANKLNTSKEDSSIEKNYLIVTNAPQKHNARLSEEFNYKKI